MTGNFQAAGFGGWPGVAGITAQAEPRCSALAKQYLGRRSNTGLKVVFLAPDKSLWDTGSHAVACGLDNADGTKHTGSVRTP